MPPIQASTARERVRCSSARFGIRAAVLLVLLTGAGCSVQEPLPKDELVRKGGVYLHPLTLQPYSGPVFTTFAGTPPRVEERASLRDGHYDGPFEWYFGQGQLSLREVYRDGKKNGPYEWYFESGKLYEKGTYQDGVLEGPYQAYYENGQMHERGTYRAGAFDGPREWYLGTRLLERVTYSDGRIDGPYERYTERGELDLRGTLHDGQPCGEWLEAGARIDYPACSRFGD
jgi:MORN repeat variant